MSGDSMLATPIGVKPERPTVLVVEDEVLIRLLIADELRNQGIHVLEASNADEALTILESELSIEVLFTDIRMPGAAGRYRFGPSYPRTLSPYQADTDVEPPAARLRPRQC